MDLRISSHFSLWGNQNKTAEAGSSRREVCRMGKCVLKDLLSWRSYKLAASHPPLHICQSPPFFPPSVPHKWPPGLAGLAFWPSRLDYCLGRFSKTAGYLRERERPQQVPVRKQRGSGSSQPQHPPARPGVFLAVPRHSSVPPAKT